MASSRSMVDPHGGADRMALRLAGGGREREGRCGGLTTGLTGARGAVERPSY
jgi:hypothetical protein